jgi:hypothetical protein
MEFRSPDFPGGVLASGLSLRRAAPNFLSAPFGLRLPTSPVSGIGADHHQRPVRKDRIRRLPPIPFPSLPFGTFIPQDPRLAATATVASDECARSGTCERTCRTETPDFPSLPVQLIADRSSFRVRYVPTGSLFRAITSASLTN